MNTYNTSALARFVVRVAVAVPPDPKAKGAMSTREATSFRKPPIGAGRWNWAWHVHEKEPEVAVEIQENRALWLPHSVTNEVRKLFGTADPHAFRILAKHPNKGHIELAYGDHLVEVKNCLDIMKRCRSIPERKEWCQFDTLERLQQWDPLLMCCGEQVPHRVSTKQGVKYATDGNHDEHGIFLNYESYESYESYEDSGEDSGAIIDVCFVHGIHGGNETWTNNKKEYWPRWLESIAEQTQSKLRVMTVLYASADLRTIEHLSQWLLTVLEFAKVPTRPTVFVCHSMGGLIVKQALLKMRSSQLQLVRGVFFYSTPHFGSDLAALAENMIDSIDSTIEQCLSGQQNAERCQKGIEDISGQSFELKAVELFMKGLGDILCSEHFSIGRVVYEAAGMSKLAQMKVGLQALSNLNCDFGKTAKKFQIAVSSVGESNSMSGLLPVSLDAACPGIGDFCAIERNHCDICNPPTEQSVRYVLLQKFFSWMKKPPHYLRLRRQEIQNKQQHHRRHRRRRRRHRQ